MKITRVTAREAPRQRFLGDLKSKVESSGEIRLK